MEEQSYTPDCDIFIIKQARTYILEDSSLLGPDILLLNQNMIKNKVKALCYPTVSELHI